MNASIQALRDSVFPSEPPLLTDYVIFRREAFSAMLTLTLQDGEEIEIEYLEEDLEGLILKHDVVRWGANNADRDDKIVALAAYITNFLEVYVKPDTGEVHAP